MILGGQSGFINLGCMVLGVIQNYQRQVVQYMDVIAFKIYFSTDTGAEHNWLSQCLLNSVFLK